MTLIGVGFGSSQDIEELTSYQDANDIPWLMAEGPDSMVRDFNVTSQSTKLGIQPDGLITFRKGYGRADPGTWRERLGELAGGA